MLDILFWSLVGSLALVTLDIWPSKPVKRKDLSKCRCFWCSG